MTVFKTVMVNGVVMQNQIIVMYVIITLQMIVFKTVTVNGEEPRGSMIVVNVMVWGNKFSIWMMMVTDMAIVR